MSAVHPGPGNPNLPAGFAAAGYPLGATPITAASGNVANANAVATLAAVGGRTTYILGCVVSASGVTTAVVFNGTIAGVITGTLTFSYAAIAGVLLQGPTLIIPFGLPGIPASAVNTAIVVTLPALGSGNTNAAVFAWGYQV